LHIGEQSWPLQTRRLRSETGHQFYEVCLGEHCQRLAVYALGARIHVLGDEASAVLDVLAGADLARAPTAVRDAGEASWAALLGVRAPMPGKVCQVLVAQGDRVRAGQVVLVLEAMKMEHHVQALADGRVTSLSCALGDVVKEGAELLRLDPGE
jgi:biotin carboxyl carrier protein